MHLEVIHYVANLMNAIISQVMSFTVESKVNKIKNNTIFIKSKLSISRNTNFFECWDFFFIMFREKKTK